ncbi:MAG: DUF1501 domain-containing protein [Planctomycetota bacterium]|nr:DUF1501 domain-containing protein [Planctomycetota bacterium]
MSSPGKSYPCGITRREAVWQMGGGFAGLALVDLLSKSGFWGTDAMAAEPETRAVGGPHFTTPVRSVIFLMMNGAPSQVDTFDFKPALRKYAGKEMPQDKNFINSGGRKIGYLTPEFRKFRPGGKSGLLISDYFPEVRKHADKLAVINSCHTDSHAHGSALVAMNTGSVFIGRPSLGSWCVYGLGTENENLPGYVVIMDKRGGPISGQPNYSAGFMPAQFQGTLFRPTGDPLLDLSAPPHIRDDVQRRQLEMIEALNSSHMRQRSDVDHLQARIRSYELAYRMQAEAPQAVSFEDETRQTIEMYGIGKKPTDEYGRNCLIARRLVERGVRFIQLYSGGGHLEDTWDAHAGIESNHGLHAAEVDRPIAALLTDLEQRGLLEETLVIWGGEFGRMPFSEGKNAPGRNHNPYGFSMWLAGGGVKGGIRYGATDELGFEAVQDKAHVHDVHATVLHLAGLDHEHLSYFYQGRKETLTDVHGRVIRDIIA